MTDFDRPVQRRTIGVYRITVSGAMPSPSGKRLVVKLHGDERGDWLTIREAGRRYSVTLEVAELYRKGMLAQAARERSEKRKARKGQGK